MKKTKLILVAIVMIASNMLTAQVAINTDGSTPDASAMLDVKSSNKGFLPPRIALSSTTDVTTISSPAISLLVYNTASTADVTPGYYYWDGSVWKSLTSSTKKSITINAFSVGLGAYSNGSNSVYVNGKNVSTSGRGAHLTVLDGNNANVIFSKDYDIHTTPSLGDDLASDLGTYNTDGNILIINTYDQPRDISTNLIAALKDIMQSKKIAYQTTDYRCAWCIIYQNGLGKLGEDLSNAYDDSGNIIGNGNTVRAVASCHITTFVGW